MALKAIAGDDRVAAFLGVGMPVATASAKNLPRPHVPALFVVGEKDTFGPPDNLSALFAGGGEIVEVSGADHFFEGNLSALEKAISRFLASLPEKAGVARGSA